MFDRYTEKARRVIFFARYEASHYSSPYIESEYLLLGLLREDRALAGRIGVGSGEQIRREIDERAPHAREKISTSVDLPLSNESKRILAYAAEEAELAQHMHIGTEHLLAGVLREERCFAAELVKKHGVTLEALRADLKSRRPDSWLGSGGGGGGLTGGFGNRRPLRPPTLEFVCGSEKLMSAIAFGISPHIGERIVLTREGVEKRYRVRDVSYRYEKPKEPMQFGVPANVTAVVPPESPFMPVSITISIEEE